MKKIIKSIVLFQILFLLAIFLTGCGLLKEIIGSDDSELEINDEFDSSTGKWILLNHDDTYFEFNGSKEVMEFNYYENGIKTYSGTYRAIYKGLGKDVTTPLTFIFTRTDKSKEDWLSCYVEEFGENFTQFTVMRIEEDLGFINGSIYTYIYRISELPYKLGTYILEGNQYKNETDNYSSAKKYYIPSGTYSLDTGESFTFLTIKPTSPELFQYKNGDIVIEGTYTIAADKKTIYLYIEHDPYNKITPEDEKQYDTTFSLYYPPDFYLIGDFSNKEYIIINDLYHHTESPIKIEDSSWVFGEYKKD